MKHIHQEHLIWPKVCNYTTVTSALNNGLSLGVQSTLGFFCTVLGLFIIYFLCVLCLHARSAAASDNLIIPYVGTYDS